jgi:hypothetical protein
MNWYLAKLVFQLSWRQHQPATTQFEEQLRLVAASNKAEALAKANSFGKEGSPILPVEKEATLQWTFIAVVQLYHLNELLDGAELLSVMQEVSDAAAYVQTLQLRASNLLENDVVDWLINSK